MPSHQPHPLSTVQVSQVDWSPHESEPQELRSHRHSEQEPLDGPVVVPVWQRSVPSHHPQELREVQSSQLDSLAQGSPDSQADSYHPQSEQLPVVGAEVEPAMQAVVARHQPHPGAAMHRAHSVRPGQGSSLEVHRPPEQDNPAQQSAVVEHVWEAFRHTQRPPAQLIRPQHSLAVVHRPEASLQQMVRPELSLQLRASQQSDRLLQPSPAGVQRTGARQTRSLHSSPAAQAGSVVQHGCPSRPHTGSQAPREQVLSHLLPQRPQFRASRSVSTQVPVQQVRAAAVQRVPSQQA